MRSVQLSEGHWHYDEAAPLGREGGFGEVFNGVGRDGPVAIKRLKLSASSAAHREMDVGRWLVGRDLSHVVPILDYGRDVRSGLYFLVMPICERSLQDEIETKGVLTVAEASDAALDVLSGLREVGGLVHRDLKPGNVLRLGGRWRLADFGIAKFVEDSTSLHTMRGSLTAAYGAPEQWKMEAPTRATDVYALGCMFHTMLTGFPPFSGTEEEVREAHLHQPPPPLKAGVRLSAFVDQMLRKDPDLRPTLDRCMQVLGESQVERARPAHAGLAAAARLVAREAAEAEAAARAAAANERRRNDLVQAASDELRQILARLWDEIESSSEEAIISEASVSLGRGLLLAGPVARLLPQSTTHDLYGASGWEMAATSTLSVKRRAINRPDTTPEGFPIFYAGRATSQDRDYTWSATLFFAKCPQDPSYRWREVAFWTLRNDHGVDEPFAISPSDDEFTLAFSNVIGTTREAYGPLAIDGEDEEDFQHRWLTLFARAVGGELERPGRMPVPDEYFR
jgi:eukaryotic-like serine/threonine-protein kinase